MFRRFIRFIALWLSFALLSGGAFAHGGGHRSGHHASRGYHYRASGGAHHHRPHAHFSHPPSYSYAPRPRRVTHHHRGRTYYSNVPASGAGVSEHNPRYRHKYHRSFEVKRQFWTMTGHPHGWPGHVVDHVDPLACGGADSPSNMQWQTIAEAKAKDRVELRGCHGGHR